MTQVDYDTHRAEGMAEVTDGLGRQWLMHAGDVAAFTFARDPDHGEPSPPARGLHRSFYYMDEAFPTLCDVQAINRSLRDAMTRLPQFLEARFPTLGREEPIAWDVEPTPLRDQLSWRRYRKD